MKSRRQSFSFQPTHFPWATSVPSLMSISVSHTVCYYCYVMANLMFLYIDFFLFYKVNISVTELYYYCYLTTWQTAGLLWCLVLLVHHVNSCTICTHLISQHSCTIWLSLPSHSSCLPFCSYHWILSSPLEWSVGHRLLSCIAANRFYALLILYPVCPEGAS